MMSVRILHLVNIHNDIRSLVDEGIKLKVLTFGNNGPCPQAV